MREIPRTNLGTAELTNSAFVSRNLRQTVIPAVVDPGPETNFHSVVFGPRASLPLHAGGYCCLRGRTASWAGAWRGSRRRRRRLRRRVVHGVCEEEVLV